MDFLNQILAFFKDHQQLLIVALGFYLVYTKRIDLSFLLNILKPPAPTPTPSPTPTPGPTPLPDLLSLIQLILQMLNQARASGDVELEKSALKLLNHASSGKV